MSLRCVIALILWSATGAVTPMPLHAADPPIPLVLSSTERAAIARTFAPILVLHPLEDYFPTSSMDRPGSDDLSPDSHRTGGQGPRPEGWPARVAQYHALSWADKVERAALGYRVFSRVQRGRPEVVVEY